MKFAKCTDKQRWDDYVVENGGHPLQLWGWGDVKSLHGWSAERLFYYDADQNVVGAVQILIKKFFWPFKSFVYVPRGPIVGDSNRDNLLLDLTKYLKNNYRAMALSIEPDMVDFVPPRGFKMSMTKILPPKTVILDLTKTEADLLADMSKKTRQYIRKSEKEAMQVRRVKNKQELAECLEIYHGTAKRAGFSLHSDAYYYDVFDKMNEFSPVFMAVVDGKPTAFLWLIISADTAFELYGGVNEIGQDLRLNYALKWHAIKKCKEWGLTRYDFGGLLDGGVTTFKMGWTEKETNLAGTFDYPLSILGTLDHPVSVIYIIWSKLFPFAKRVVRMTKGIFGR